MSWEISCVMVVVVVVVGCSTNISKQSNKADIREIAGCDTPEKIAFAEK